MVREASVGNNITDGGIGLSGPRHTARLDLAPEDGLRGRPGQQSVAGAGFNRLCVHHACRAERGGGSAVQFWNLMWTEVV